MAWLALASIFAVVFISVAIAAIANRYELRPGRAIENATRAFLYSRNTENLAVASNVGSSLSLTLFVGAIIPGVAGFGLVPIVGIYVGLVSGLLLLIFVGRRITASDSRTTLAGLVPSDAANAIRGAEIILYIASITLELALARHLIARLIGNAALAIIVVGILVFICASYTALGGFIGVLRTDVFQFLVLIAGLVIISLNVWRPLRATVGRSMRAEYVSLNDPALLLASWIIVVAFFFGSPDLWIRTFGTLHQRGASPQRAIVKSLGFLMIAFIPPICLGLSWLTDAGHLRGSLNVFDAADYVVQRFHAAVEGGASSTTIWFVSGAAACALITTIDTQFLGLAQHIPRAADKNLNDVRFAIVTTGLATFLCSLSVGPRTWLLLGLIVFGLLLLNGLLVLSAAGLLRLQFRRSLLHAYYKTCLGPFLLAALVLSSQLDQRFHTLILLHVVWTSAWLMIMRRREVRNAIA
jgi:Na+/proline symporter